MIHEDTAQLIKDIRESIKGCEYGSCSKIHSILNRYEALGAKTKQDYPDNTNGKYPKEIGLLIYNDNTYSIDFISPDMPPNVTYVLAPDQWIVE